MPSNLQKWAEAHGALIAWGDASLAHDALAEIDNRRARNEFDEEFYRARLDVFPDPAGFCSGRARTLVLMAVPRPAHGVTFMLDSVPLRAVLPPTYVQYDTLRETLLLELSHQLSGEARCVEILRAPLRSIASRLGLVEYGRNNLAYAPEFGSYHQLLGYVTDLEFDEPSPFRLGEMRLMAQCEKCNLCREACPTEAIPNIRFLLRAERCLTYHSETPGPWPSWLPPSAHHCLLGCLKCQDVCPQNPDLQVESTGVSFSMEETKALLEEGGHPEVEHNTIAPPCDSIRTKLDRLDLSEDERVLGRNLRALIEAQILRCP